LTGELFSKKVFDIKHIDAEVLDMRRAYHQTEDAVSKCMNVSHVRNSAIFDRIKIVDFYRYSSVNLTDMYTYLDKRLPWIRPSDTGRSTNCLINDVGIYVHRKERGFHNYSLPYSWDVRLGHKERNEALEELNDEIDETYVNAVLEDIGYRIETAKDTEANKLALYYVSESTEVTPARILGSLQQHLPAWMLPTFIVPLEALPLSTNGKINRHLLPRPAANRMSSKVSYRAPTTPREKWLANLWADLLKIDNVGLDDNYFDLNGDSLTAIRLVSRINQEGFGLTVNDLFDSPSIAELIPRMQQTATKDSIDGVTALANENDAKPFGSISQEQRARLNKLLSRQSPN